MSTAMSTPLPMSTPTPNPVPTLLPLSTLHATTPPPSVRPRTRPNATPPNAQRNTTPTPSTQRTTTPTPTTLDHTAYPHILDAVVEHAPRDVLLALRTASHYLRTLADRRLCAHAELHLTAAPSWHLVSAASVATSATPLSTSSNTHPNPPPAHRLPLLPGDTHASCLASIQTITLCTPPSQRRMARKDLLLPTLNLQAHTLRLPDPFVHLSIEGLASNAKTLIVFEEVGKSFNCDKTGWFFPPTVSGTKVPEWARRYVLNVRVRVEEGELAATSWGRWGVVSDGQNDGGGREGKEDGPGDGDSAREVVVILRSVPGPRSRALQPTRHELGLLHGLAEGVAAHPEWRWTVVGVPELMAAAPHAVPAAHDVCGRFGEVAGREVAFCSLEEYRIRVGAGLEVEV